MYEPPLRPALSRTRARDVLHAVGTIQSACSQRDVQAAYLQTVSGVVTAAGHGFYVLDPETLRPVDVAATVPDVFLQRYEDEGRSDDPVLQEAVASGRPADSSRLSPGRCWQGSAVFQVLEQAGYRHSLEAPVLVDGAVHGTLNMARSPQAPPFSAEDLETMATLAEQIGAAMTRARRFDQVSERTIMLADALDAVAQPVVVTTVDGTLIFRNRMAFQTVPGSDVSFLERALPVLDKALDALRSGDRRVVSTQEQAVTASHGPPGLGRSAPGGDGAGRHPGLLAIKAIRLRSRHDAVVAFLSFQPRDHPGLPEASLPLSPRERHLADLVSQGLTTRRIAELSFVSENTVKQHLKRIFAKLQVSSRAELVHTVWRSASATAAPGDTGGAAWNEAAGEPCSATSDTARGAAPQACTAPSARHDPGS
jgi:DNA-binding CsgD family transcriptional regulator/GAF domain-containing protein